MWKAREGHNYICDLERSWEWQRWRKQWVVLNFFKPCSSLLKPKLGSHFLKFQFRGQGVWICHKFTGCVSIDGPGVTLWELLEKVLWEARMLERLEGRRRRGQQRMRWLGGHHRLDGHEFEQAQGWWWTWKPGVLGSQRFRLNWVNQTELRMLEEWLDCCFKWWIEWKEWRRERILGGWGCCPTGGGSVVKKMPPCC